MIALKALHTLKGKDHKKTFAYLVEMKTQLIEEKKSIYKNNVFCKADQSMIITPEYDGVESLGLNADEVFIVGNSIGFFDNHEDVSLKGSWNQTVEERKERISIVKDHRYLVDNIYAKNCKSIITDLPIRALGYDMDGMTQVIGFKIKPYSETDMQKYIDGSINQHSMGLMYNDLVLAINDPEYEEEFQEWQKYIGQVINIAQVEKNGYFWGVKQQEAIECSSVVLASNPFTPAFTNKSLSSKGKQSKDAPKVQEQIKTSNFYQNFIRV